MKLYGRIQKVNMKYKATLLPKKLLHAVVKLAIARSGEELLLLFLLFVYIDII